MGLHQFQLPPTLITGRRRVLIGGAAFAGTLMIRSVFDRSLAATTLFTLGVASGDPSLDGFVLWTRLAANPLQGGGMPRQSIPVQWYVSTDPEMKVIVQQGTAIALPESAHAIHVEVAGLQPNRPYWYQFKVKQNLSPIGRSRTAPMQSDQLQQLRFAFVSCQNYAAGYYTAYRDIAAAELDLVVHLGDYIYEGSITPSKPRNHSSPEATTLQGYRDRYALYKLDPDLQAAHAAHPWIVTWDDHEVENNYANLISQKNIDPKLFAQRRAAAYQAYYEHMPLRRSSLPKGANAQIYRRLQFGNLATFHVMDTRQYRTDQPCGDNIKPRCAEALSGGTMLGDQQEQWLFTGLTRSQTTWNVLAQGLMMAQFNVQPRSQAGLFNMDAWDGYVPSRTRLLEFLSKQRVSNPVVIAGDVHASFASDLKLDFNQTSSPTVATEFVGTSISSGFSQEAIMGVKQALSDNPHVRFFDGAFRGYVLCTLTQTQWRTDFRAVSTVLTSQGTVSTLASVAIAAGQPGVQPA